MALVFLAAILFEVADLSVGESARLQNASIRLLAVDERKDEITGVIRQAQVKLEVDGKAVTLGCANYNLPQPAGNVQVDCTVTGGYNANTTTDHWGLKKDARIRAWKKGSPWIEPGTFGYPVRQKWFVTQTQMSNEPTYVDRGERSDRKKIYYHSGLDIGGAEELTEVVAATDALIVSLGDQYLPDHTPKTTPVRQRYDVIYLLDGRGWYYRYSHFHSFDPGLKLGARVTKGQRLGLLGKEGGSGGWTHLHFEIVSRQPSGEWGTQEGYAFLWEAWQREHPTQLLAVARPHHFATVGEKVVLDGSRSMGAVRYEWNGKPSVRLEKIYDKPGTYSEVLKIYGKTGEVAYDFATVNVLVKGNPGADPVTIHAVYWPSLEIKPKQEITFKVRTFGTTRGEESWDFGDGARASSRSDGNVVKLAKDGYATLKHAYSKPGDYIVTVHREGATTRLWVRVKP